MHSLTVVNTDGSGAKRLHVTQADRTSLDWSADGRLAFTAVQGRTLWVSTVDAETEEEVAVAGPWDLAGHARWSPDSRLLAFEAAPPGGNITDVHVVEAEGGEAEPLTHARPSYWDSQWVGDTGAMLLLGNAGMVGTVELYLCDPGGAMCTRLLRFRDRTVPRIAWPRGSDTGIAVLGRHIWKLSPSGDSERLLETEHATWADLAPYGESLVYVRWQEHRPSLVVRQLADGAERELLSPPDPGLGYSKLAWAPAGGEIAFIRGGDLCTVPSEGGAVTVLWSGDEDANSTVLAPAWSADGAWLAFGRFRRQDGQHLDILVSSADGGGAGLVASCAVESEPGLLSDPLSSPYAWSPNSNELAFCLEERGRPAIYLASVLEGGIGTRELLRTEAAFPHWSPDGEQIAYTSLDGAADQIHLLRPADGADTVFEPTLSVPGGEDEEEQS
jgi:dipeptidyl aminopeptidase/acylaminoacyl peptidase